MAERDPFIAGEEAGIVPDEPIDIRIVRDPARFDVESFERSRRTILEQLGTDVDVTIDFVDHIDSEENGKYRFIVSRVYRDSLHRQEATENLEEALA